MAGLRDCLVYKSPAHAVVPFSSKLLAKLPLITHVEVLQMKISCRPICTNTSAIAP